MKNLIFLCFFTTLNFFGQSNRIFDVEISELEMNTKGNGFYSFKPVSKYFYEDENYIVTDSCNGEFGGNLYFQDKKSEIKYTISATCPVIINKIKNNYFVTTSLAHMRGSCQLIQIENPEELKEVTTLNYNDYKNSLIGAKPLLSEFGKTIIISFLHNEKLYHIVSERNETYIAFREKTELIRIQNLTKFGMYSYGNEIYLTENNEYCAIFQTNHKQGYIIIKDNKIKITIYK